MRRLFPDPIDDVDLTSAYAVPAGRRHVRANFVSSVDGAVTVDGTSRALSSDADRALFHVLRTLADVVLVGAGTARAEHYGGAKSSGDRPPPPIAVVTRSLDLEPASRLFTDTQVRPIVLTCASSPPSRRAALAELADVIVAGDDDVQPALAIDALAERGLLRVLCEGGPHLLGWLVAANVLDELCLTLAPVMAGGMAGRIVAGLETQVADPMRLAHVLEDAGSLFLRYAIADSLT